MNRLLARYAPRRPGPPAPTATASEVTQPERSSHGPGGRPLALSLEQDGQVEKLGYHVSLQPIASWTPT
jgi:hypothetical protein